MHPPFLVLTQEKEAKRKSRRQGRQPSLPGTHHNSSTTQQTNSSTSPSDGDLDRETADGSDYAFVVSVAGGAWAAEDGVTVAPQPIGQGVHLRRAAHAEGDVGVTETISRGGRKQCRPRHDLQPGTAAGKGEEIRSELLRRVVIERTGGGVEITLEEVARRLQISGVERHMLDA